mmetsp:Transcript_14725/g.22835  ORF Transcript_14725/g.22835 Transcript_14725/m.22835 type:complete len:284 (+) Transcript_14725:3-854(+)
MMTSKSAIISLLQRRASVNVPSCLSRRGGSVLTVQQTRSAVTSSIEPRGDADNLASSSTDNSSYFERPGALVYYKQPPVNYAPITQNDVQYNSVMDNLNTMSSYFPSRGMHYMEVRHEPPVSISKTDTNYPMKYILNDLVDDLQMDIGATTGSIVVTYGAFTSIVAQYYLESWALSGLVMIDPVLPQLSTVDGNEIRGDTGGEKSTLARSLFCEQSTNRRLKLEPGSAPMLVLSCSSFGDNDFLAGAAQSVADYHGGDYIRKDEKNLKLNNVIFEWIDENVPI